MGRNSSSAAAAAFASLALLAGNVNAVAATVYTYTYTGSVGTFAAPTSGRYSVEAIGAAGVSAQAGFTGGSGAEVIGDFNFRRGQTYQYAVGGMGTSDGCSGGGGGGTFFVDSSGDPLIVAGGGGGTRMHVLQNGTDASLTPYGTNASGSNETYTPTTKTMDLGQGGIVSSGSWGSGGAGFYGDGASDFNPGQGGTAWASGLAGGAGPAAGGFGGGGSGNGSCGGGGGGGYSGGDGGRVAGGGGSYDTGLDPLLLAGVGAGDGELIITLLQALGLVENLPANASHNQFNVATAIDAASNQGSNGPAAIQNLYNLTGPQLAQAMTQLSGEASTGANAAAFEMMDDFLSVLVDPFVDGRGGDDFPDSPSGVMTTNGGPLAYADQTQNASPAQRAMMALAVTKGPAPLVYQPHYSAWVSGYGGIGNFSGSATVGSHNVTAAAYGSAAGLDYHVNANTVIGLALAGAGMNWGLSDGLGGGQGDAFQAGVYGSTRFGRFYVAGAFGFANHWITTNRQALGDSLSANFDAQSYGGRIEGGYRIPVALPLPILQSPVTIVPYAAVQPQDFHTPAYSERDIGGAGFGLNYNSADATDVRTELGLRGDTLVQFGGTRIDLFTRTAWAHDFVSTPSLTAVFQTLPGSNFTVFGAKIPRNSALVTDGAQLWLTPALSIIAKFDGELASGSDIYSGTGTIRYVW